MPPELCTFAGGQNITAVFCRVPSCVVNPGAFHHDSSRLALNKPLDTSCPQ